MTFSSGASKTVAKSVLTEQRPLGHDTRPHRLDLGVDLLQTLRVLPQRRHPLGPERRQHEKRRHGGTLPHGSHEAARWH